MSEATLGQLGYICDSNPMTRVADDFMVTGPAGWQLTRFRPIGYVPGATMFPGFQDVRLSIWDGPPGEPGSNVVYQSSPTSFFGTSLAPLYRIPSGGDPLSTQNPCFEFLSNISVVLLPGTYWAAWDVVGDGFFGVSTTWAPTGPGVPGNARATTDNWQTFTQAPEGLAWSFEGIELAGIGSAYCGPGVPNSTGLPGRLGARGVPAAQVNDLTITGTQLPPGEFAYLLNSMSSDFVVGPGGSQGNLCLGGAIGRHTGQVGLISPDGVFGVPLDLTSLPIPTGTASVSAGQTWFFQLWHRDTNPTGTSNFTEGLEVTFS